MEFNSLLFPQPKSKLTLEVILNGKIAYLPKLKKISEDSQIPISPKSYGVQEKMALYLPQNMKATKNIKFISTKEKFFKRRIQQVEDQEQKNNRYSQSNQVCLSEEVQEKESNSLASLQQLEEESENFGNFKKDNHFKSNSHPLFSIKSKSPHISPKSSFLKNVFSFGKQQISSSEQCSPTRTTQCHSKLNSEQTSSRSTSNERESSFLSEMQQQDPKFRGFDMSIEYPIGFVPALYLESRSYSNNLLIYFHGNGDDVFSSYNLMNHLRISLQINVLAVEYPGYGNFQFKRSCSEETILEDAEYTFSFVTNQLSFNPQNIILLGRSLGTGPATYLASLHQVGALALISAFTSIQGVVSGFAGIFKYMVKERFNNLENIKRVKAPVFLLHGKKDKLISYKQSATLYQNCSIIESELHFSSEMTHSSFDYEKDLSQPLTSFLIKNQFPLFTKNFNRTHLPEGLTFHPSYYSLGTMI